MPLTPQPVTCKLKKLAFSKYVFTDKRLTNPHLHIAVQHARICASGDRHQSGGCGGVKQKKVGGSTKENARWQPSGVMQFPDATAGEAGSKAKESGPVHLESARFKVNRPW